MNRKITHRPSVCPQAWAVDVCMASLLIAAFAATNALSLIYLAIVLLSMTLAPGRRAVLWARCALPLLALLLVQQYAACVASSPAWAYGVDKRRAQHQLQAWLGLRDVDQVTVALLYAAYGLGALMVRMAHALTMFALTISTLIMHRGPYTARWNTQVQLQGWQQYQHSSPVGTSPHLWKPLQLAARSQWNAIDHCRLLFYR